MVEIKPVFYDKFHCTAGECPMTCCMQWKIAVDDETYAKWKKIKWPDGVPEKSDSLADAVTQKDGGRVIRLNESKYCPFLNSKKLCALVLEHGDSVLSHTCDTFPRQVHDFENRRELSLVSCCPAVVDYYRSESFHLQGEIPKGDLLAKLRELMMNILSDDSWDMETALKMIFYILLDLYDKEAERVEELDEYSAAAFWRKLYDSIKDVPVCAGDFLVENLELWLDMVENYRKEGLYLNYIEDISKEAEQILGTMDTESLQKNYEEFRKHFRDYEFLFRNYLAAELFTNLLLPGSDMESVVVMFQWIAMEYVMIREALFLKFMQEENLPYERVRDLMVVVQRMTGYDEADIFEYMENSFQSLIWEWGYMALILGA
ncbi:MAG: flagellin lysine-N-methylase [Lachnospiraceae bacterium]